MVSASSHSGLDASIQVKKPPNILMRQFDSSLKGQSHHILVPVVGIHFSFWKIKLVLSAGPLMILKFFYFVVPEILKN